MRLFVATELPEGMRDALAETSAALRDAVRGRYVATDSLHVTLAFLGEVSGTRVPELVEALERACAGHGPLEAVLGELGSFGRSRSAVLWQAVRAEGLSELAEDVRSALREAGFAIDEKGFMAHITLMRQADLAHGVLPMPSIANGTIDTVTLFRSDLSGPRPTYEPLARIELTER